MPSRIVGRGWIACRASHRARCSLVAGESKLDGVWSHDCIIGRSAGSGIRSFKFKVWNANPSSAHPSALVNAQLPTLVMPLRTPVRAIDKDMYYWCVIDDQLTA